MNNSFESIKYSIPKLEYKVLVMYSTFNQSKYIENALNSFTIQKTDFPFVCLVMDDASIDGEQKILRCWIENHCNIEDVERYDHPLAIIGAR